MNQKNPCPQKKLDFNKEMENIIEDLANAQSSKKKLLLHACCAPCSSAVLERLAKIFDITIFYYNPNIHPKNEYERRLEELKKFLNIFPDSIQNSVKLVIDEYNIEDYFEATKVREEKELQTEAEKGERCRRCYEFRMKKAFDYARKNDFDFFTTTLSISPHKDSEKINAIGKELEKSVVELVETTIITEKEKSNCHFDKLNDQKTKFLPSDFKKKGGFLRSTQLSEEYGLWRQDYCGCIFSKQNLQK